MQRPAKTPAEFMVLGLSFQAQVQQTLCVCVCVFFFLGGCSGMVYDKNEELLGITTTEDDSGSSY